MYINVKDIKLTTETFIDNDGEIYVPLSEVRKAIALTPAADVQEVRHGKWIERRIPNDTGTLVFVCSVCSGKQEWVKRNFCPNCGAQMDERAQKSEMDGRSRTF